MKDYLHTIGRRFPVRFTPEQKRAFEAAALASAKKAGWDAHIGELPKKQSAHRNIIIGDPSSARVLITSHYDTPARSLFPDTRRPRNPFLFLLRTVGEVLLLLAASFAAALLVSRLVTLDRAYFLLLTVLVYFALMFFCFRFRPNPVSANGADSGAAAVLEVMEALPEDARHKAAFILFDDGDGSLRGSKAWAQQHPDIAWTIPAVDLSCVGYGTKMLFAAKRAVACHPDIAALQDAARPKYGFEPRFCRAFPLAPRTDAGNLPLSVAVCACRTTRAGGAYIPFLRTPRDTIAEGANIGWLTDVLVRWVAALPEKGGGNGE